MGHLSETVFLPVTVAERAAWSYRRANDAGNVTGYQIQQSLTIVENQPPILPPAPECSLLIGLIDHYRLSQDCLLHALQSLNPQDTLISYATPDDCIAGDPVMFDLIIYYSHENGAPQATTLSNVAALHRAYPQVSLVVLSDAEDTQQAEASREVLKHGASGFIPTRTSSIFLTIGAIRFVKQGGSIDAPAKPAPAKRLAEATNLGRRLTSREMAVLRLMQRGKANKIIAHELSLSENTVKIHVRNVIRKMDATNRTQAVDKARKLWGANAGFTSERPAWCRRKAGDRRVDRRHGPGDDGG